MQQPLLSLLAPPVFADDDKQRSARFVNAISLVVISILALLLVIRISTSDTASSTPNLILGGLLIAMLAVQIIMRVGQVYAAGLTTTVIGWIAMTYLAITAGGVRDAAIIAYLPVILIASLLMGWRTATLFTGLSIAAVWLMAFLETRGILVVSTDTTLNIARDITLVFALSGHLIYLLVTNLRSSLELARKSTRELAANYQELDNLRANLEDRVEARTAELGKRARQLRAVSSVARAVTSIQDVDKLLSEVGGLISDQFGFYHVGIFLLDETNTNVMLTASNSEGGQKMLARRHSLGVGSNSIVGTVASTREPRVALDTGLEANFFNNPDLPETHSEMALPLKIGTQLIGVLDVQSKEANAFDAEDVAVLGTLADQVTVAIQNARLFGETRRALAAAEESYKKYIGRAWTQFSDRSRLKGFKLEKGKLLPLTEVSKENTVRPNTLIIPLKVRDQVIGTLEINSDNKDRAWSENEIGVAEAAADRAALSLENVRLFDETARRAETERVTSEISSKIGASIRAEAIIQTAAEELSRALGGSDVLVQIQPIEPKREEIKPRLQREAK